MEAAGCIAVSTCYSRPSQTFPYVNDSKHLSIALADSQSPPKNVSAEKLPEKVARLCRTLLNSNRGIQCTQKLHVHVDFYTKKNVFENTLNISQNERLSQRQHPRNIASNYVCTTQIAPPL